MGVIRHGGRDCAEFVRENLHMNLVRHVKLQGGLDTSFLVHRDLHFCLREVGRGGRSQQLIEGVNSGWGHDMT